MRKNAFCLLLLIVFVNRLTAQLNESFADGNFTNDPAWNGNVADWQITANSDVSAGAVNANTLRLNVAAGAGTTWISTHVTGSWGMAQHWGFFVGRRGQAYTASNHVFIWLWCNESNLTSATADGYRIRIGDDGGGDEITLQRVTDGVPFTILTSAATLANNITDIGLLLRVTRTGAGEWELFTSALPAANGTGAVATNVPNALNANVLQGSTTDNTYTNFDNGHTGFVNVYGSSAAARTAQEFDQVQLSFTSAAMPVKLQSFDAVFLNGAAKLSWEAAEETGVKAYEVQRSNNGIDFSAIGSVNAERKRYYSFTDGDRRSQNSFYRLRISDIDGSSRLTHIVGIRSKAVDRLQLSPNPVAGIAVLQHPKASANCSVRVWNMEGILVRQCTIEENAVLSRLNMSALPHGSYHLVFLSGNTRLSIAFVRQ